MIARPRNLAKKVFELHDKKLGVYLIPSLKLVVLKSRHANMASVR